MKQQEKEKDKVGREESKKKTTKECETSTREKHVYERSKMVTNVTSRKGERERRGNWWKDK